MFLQYREAGEVGDRGGRYLRRADYELPLEIRCKSKKTSREKAVFVAKENSPLRRGMFLVPGKIHCCQENNARAHTRTFM